jgi:hypothetical protein
MILEHQVDIEDQSDGTEEFQQMIVKAQKKVAPPESIQSAPKCRGYFFQKLSESTEYEMEAVTRLEVGPLHLVENLDHSSDVFEPNTHV